MVLAARDDALAIGRPGDSANPARMARIGEDVSSCDGPARAGSYRGGIPELHGLVIAGRGDTFAIRRPCHGTHKSRMAAIGEDVFPTRSIPHLNSHSIAGGNQLTI